MKLGKLALFALSAAVFACGFGTPSSAQTIDRNALLQDVFDRAFGQTQLVETGPQLAVPSEVSEALPIGTTGTAVEPLALAADPQQAGTISLAFDDGLKSVYTAALPVLKARSLRGTAYAYPSAILRDRTRKFMTWAELRTLQNANLWEIGSHTYSHADLTALSESAMLQELQRAKTYFSAYGIKADGFAAPFGGYNQAVQNAVARHHAYLRTAWNGNNSMPYSDYEIKAVEVSYTMTPEAAYAIIDEAMARKEWLVLYWHDITADGSAPYTYSLANFTKIADYIKAKNYPVKTVAEALKSWASGSNLVSNGSFESLSGSEASGWYRNDSANVTYPASNLGSYPSQLRSARIIAGANQRQISSQPIAIDQGANYRLKSYSRVENFGGGSASVWASEFDAAGSYIGGQWLGGIFANFTGTRYYVYYPSAGTAKIELFFYAPAGSLLTWNIDNVELKSL